MDATAGLKAVVVINALLALVLLVALGCYFARMHLKRRWQRRVQSQNDDMLAPYDEDFEIVSVDEAPGAYHQQDPLFSGGIGDADAAREEDYEDTATASSAPAVQRPTPTTMTSAWKRRRHIF